VKISGSRSVVFNVGEIASRGGFMIYTIWGTISVSRGAFSAG